MTGIMHYTTKDVTFVGHYANEDIKIRFMGVHQLEDVLYLVPGPTDF